MDEGFEGLRLHNTLTGKKEDFVPFDPRNVRMYVCGPTVYDFAHIGNARPVIVFDVLFRLLRHLYGAEHVTYARNITDVDDKIIQRAAEDFPDLPLNEAIGKVTATTEKQFHEDVAALGCLQPTVEPRATEHVAKMVEMIGVLVAQGYAYAEQGHVLFEVRKWKAADGSAEYGKLSRRSLDDMIAGARVEVAPYKRDPMDFVLWKPSKPGEPSWPSPWGEGRPGWHIECSAMAKKHLGETFDIHAGGIDLVFPHHENEIAQSRTANHTDVMAKYWLHNGFLQVEGRKMAKSEGNFVTIRELLKSEAFGGRVWPGEVLRFAMLRTHYRQPIDWSVKSLEDADNVIRNWSQALRCIQTDEHDSEGVPSDDVLRALSDDLNTPAALSAMHAHAKSGRSGDRSAARSLYVDAELLGLQPYRWRAYEDAMLFKMATDTSYDAVDEKLAARAAARKARNFAEADRIRDELDAMGVQLKDSKNPETGELVTTWEVKR